MSQSGKKEEVLAYISLISPYISNAQLLPMFFTKVSPLISLNLPYLPRSPTRSSSPCSSPRRLGLGLGFGLGLGLGLGLAKAQPLPMFFTKALKLRVSPNPNPP